MSGILLGRQSYVLFMTVCLVIAAICFAAAMTPALARNECSSWQLAKEQREEGRMWTASVCAAANPRPAMLELVCFGEQLNLRFSPVIANDADFSDAGMTFSLDTGETRHRLKLGFEGMDGAFATVLRRQHPLFEAMMSGNQLVISETNGKLSPVTFTLSGSRRAMTKLMQRCR